MLFNKFTCIKLIQHLYILYFMYLKKCIFIINIILYYDTDDSYFNTNISDPKLISVLLKHDLFITCIIIVGPRVLRNIYVTNISLMLHPSLTPLSTFSHPRPPPSQTTHPRPPPHTPLSPLYHLRPPPHTPLTPLSPPPAPSHTPTQPSLTPARLLTHPSHTPSLTPTRPHHTDECVSNPCYNQATCTDQVNSYTCACPLTYSGTHCQTRDNVCSTATCNGACSSDVDNNVICVCNTGYYGTVAMCV